MRTIIFLFRVQGPCSRSAVVGRLVGEVARAELERAHGMRGHSPRKRLATAYELTKKHRQTLCRVVCSVRQNGGRSPRVRSGLWLKEGVPGAALVAQEPTCRV